MNRLKCKHCNKTILGRKYCYQGGCFCTGCFSIFFKLKNCSICNTRKRILDKMKTPICKKCLYDNTPCIRCNKKVSGRYKVTEFGAVCKSCGKYFRELKQCSRCNKKNTSVANRKLKTGIELICAHCFSETLPLCFKCKYRKNPYFYDFNKNPICKVCAIEVTRQCRYCNAEISPGSGHICLSCSQLRTFKRRAKFDLSALSPYLSNYYQQFCDWLLETRSVHYSSAHINLYLPYFIKLDELANSLNRIPTYKEVVDTYTVAETRRNLLVTLFFDVKKIITIDKVTKEEYSNIDSIERYLNRFKKGSFSQKSLQEYSNILHKKLAKNKTTIRSIRLALTPAVKLCDICIHFELAKPNNAVLEGFLWVSPGQRAAISGFINFLKQQYQIDIKVPVKKEEILSRPKSSKSQIKQRLITLLRNPQTTEEYRNLLITVSLAYFHRISVPNFVYISGDMILKNKKGDNYFKLAGQVFYLPRTIVDNYNLKEPIAISVP